MGEYLYKDLCEEEKVACIIIAINTLFNSGNADITVELVNNEVDVICKIYRREELIKRANESWKEYRINNSKFSK